MLSHCSLFEGSRVFQDNLIYLGSEVFDHVPALQVLVCLQLHHSVKESFYWSIKEEDYKMNLMESQILTCTNLNTVDKLYGMCLERRVLSH